MLYTIEYLPDYCWLFCVSILMFIMPGTCDLDYPHNYSNLTFRVINMIEFTSKELVKYQKWALKFTVEASYRKMFQ